MEDDSLSLSNNFILLNNRRISWLP